MALMTSDTLRTALSKIQVLDAEADEHVVSFLWAGAQFICVQEDSETATRVCDELRYLTAEKFVAAIRTIEVSDGDIYMSIDEYDFVGAYDDVVLALVETLKNSV